MKQKVEFTLKRKKNQRGNVDKESTFEDSFKRKKRIE